jgi:outer membrane biosynthesis protein TonB
VTLDLAVRRLVILFAFLAAASISAAKPPFLKVFMAFYKIDPNSVIGKTRCLNCHEAPGPPNRNPYGKLVKLALTENGVRMVSPEILEALETKNMGEGLTFIQKIKKDLPPGQPAPKEALAKPKPTPPADKPKKPKSRPKSKPKGSKRGG